MMHRFSIIGITVLMVTCMSWLATPVILAQRFENYQIFGTLPQNDKGRQLQDCLAGLDDFLYATIGNTFSQFGNDFTDYWRDFALSASHYADVYGVQRQLNKARYAVIGAFLRCDVSRAKQVTKQYYRLEGELFFVRHFIDTVFDDFPDTITLDAERRQFAQEVVEYLTAKSPTPEDNNQQLALYSGYFDLYVAKYRDKVQQYKEDRNESDPAWSQLKQKWEALMATFKSFGSEVGALGGDVSQLGEAVVPDFDKDSSKLFSLIASIASRFDACIEIDGERSCVSDEKKIKDMLTTSSSHPKSFGDVLFAVDVQKRDEDEDISETDMLTRYEILYGRVGGSGIKALIERVDTFTDLITIGNGNTITGSFKALDKIYQCVDNVEDKQCT